MDLPTVKVILTAGLPIILINELIVWKLWSRCSRKDVGGTRQTFVSTFFIDPLVAAIASPLAADLYSVFQWGQQCEYFFAGVITVVQLVLYASSLVVCYRLVAIMSPRKLNEGTVSPYVPLSPQAASFGLSIVLNALLTWITLAIAPAANTDAVLYESESCLASVKHRSVLLIFVMCFAIQFVHVVFYAKLSHSVVRTFKRALYEQLTNQHTEEHVIEELEDSDVNSVVMYCLTALTSLALTNVLRFTYTLCSCQYFLTLAVGLYLTNWVVALKLPVTGVAFWVISKLATLKQKG